MSEETRRTAKLLSGRLELRSAQVSFVSPPEPVWFVMGGSAKSAGGESEQERGDKERKFRKTTITRNQGEILGRGGREEVVADVSGPILYL